MELTRTRRGFEIGEFQDVIGNPCSIQESSIATMDAIWFGRDVLDPPSRLMGAGRAEAELMFPKEQLYCEVNIRNRMHIGKKEARKIVFHMQRFVRRMTLSITDFFIDTVYESKCILYYNDDLFVLGVKDYPMILSRLIVESIVPLLSTFIETGELGGE